MGVTTLRACTLVVTGFVVTGTGCSLNDAILAHDGGPTEHPDAALGHRGTADASMGGAGEGGTAGSGGGPSGGVPSGGTASGGQQSGGAAGGLGGSPIRDAGNRNDAADAELDAGACSAAACTTPPVARCSGNGVESYAAPGACRAGSCDYTAKITACPSNQTCSAGPVCALCKTDDACGENCTACAAPTAKCLDERTESVCVQCLSDDDCATGSVCATSKNHTCVQCLNSFSCSGSTPICVSATNKCVQCTAPTDCKSGQCDRQNNTCDGPSCVGLAKTCGSSGAGNCCASALVPGGSFYRSYDGVTYTDKGFPATISDFRLDTYEITVGRFRKFLSAYPANKPAAGSGKNPNNATDSGWDASWSTSLPADATALRTAINCAPGNQTWSDTAGAGENLPMSCINWYEAFAFCVWDGGRLPTDAEWNYAAAGGDEQRALPWSSPPTSMAIDCLHANYLGAKGESDFCVSPGVGAANAVGSESPLGDGRFGNSDLAGNMWEWMLDWYRDPYGQVTCTNCANTTAGRNRVIRGGSFGEKAPDVLPAARNGIVLPGDRYGNVGARCARAP